MSGDEDLVLNNLKKREAEVCRGESGNNLKIC